MCTCSLRCPCIFNDPVYNTMRRRGGYRGIFRGEGVDSIHLDTGAYFRGNYGSRIGKSLRVLCTLRAPLFPCFNDVIHLSDQMQVTGFKNANPFHPLNCVWFHRVPQPQPNRNSTSTIIRSVFPSGLEASWSQNAPCVQNIKNRSRK